MDSLTAQFWLPGHSSDQLAGELILNNDGAPKISVQGKADHLKAIQSALSVEGGLIHGRADFPGREHQDLRFGNQLTVFGDLEYTYDLPRSDQHFGVEWEPKMVVRGPRLEEPPKSEKCTFSFNTMPVFLDRRLISSTSESLSAARETLWIELDHLDLASRAGDIKVRLWGATQQLKGQRSLHFDQMEEFVCEAPSQLSVDDWHSDVVEPIRYLLSLLFPAPTKCVFLSFGGLATDADTWRAWRVYQRGIALVAEPMDEAASIREHPILRLTDRGPIPFDSLIPKWFSLWSSQRDPIRLLLNDSIRQGDLSPELIFLTAVQALEGFHRGLTGMPQQARSEDEHSALVSQILNLDFSDGDRRWIEDRIKWNEPSLRKRLRDLSTPIESVPLGLVLGGGRRTSHFIDIVTRTRNWLSHRTTVDSPQIWTEDEELMVLGECIRTIVVIHILDELGISFADQHEFTRQDRRFDVANRWFQPLYRKRYAEDTPLANRGPNDDALHK